MPVVAGGAREGAVVDMCGSCHAVEEAVATRRSERDWKDVIQLMVDRGATGSEDDFKIILSYLAKNYGPK